MKFKCFEYIQIELTIGDLSTLCSYGSVGWEMSHIVGNIAILKREIRQEDDIKITRDYWAKSHRGLK